VTVEAASAAGVVGAKRVLDSTPLYDAVATMDTVTLIRSAIRGLLKVADDALAAGLRSVLSSGDDYATAAKPQIDWDDPEAREALIDSRAKDAFACLALLDGRELAGAVADAAVLLATVAGQDLEETDDGMFRVARRVAKDRIISTVDPEARHGHKTSARGFDGYKGHVAIDPDSEIVTDTAVTAANAGDASVAEALIDDLIDNGAADDMPDVVTRHQAATGRTKRGGGQRRRRTSNKKHPAQKTRSQRAKIRRPAGNARGKRRRASHSAAPGRPCTATPPTALASSWITWPNMTSSRAARPSRLPPPADCSPKTASLSTSTTTPSPARPRSQSSSAQTPTATGWLISATTAPAVRCVPNAPTPKADAPSESAVMSNASPRPASNSKTPSGPTTIGPPAPKSNANSVT
jgi:hypothetical protein